MAKSNPNVSKQDGFADIDAMYNSPGPGNATPLQQQHHPFGKEEQVSRQQLFVAFCNNLYLGQWELARACAQRLAKLSFRTNESDENLNITEVLKAVVRYPYCRLVIKNILIPFIPF